MGLISAIDTSVRVGNVLLKNPVIAASGTFGFGREMSEWLNPGLLGAVVSKGLTRLPRLGNPAPRVAETASGMLNSVGLQNPGLDYFLSDEYPNMMKYGCPVIVNVAGDYVEDRDGNSCSGVLQARVEGGALRCRLYALVSDAEGRRNRQLIQEIDPQMI